VDVSRHKTVATLRGYVRDADAAAADLQHEAQKLGVLIF
jgi:hypothetical protein